MEDLMVRRKLRTFIGATAVLTVLSGIAMYARLAMVSDGAFARSRTGMVLGLGGVIAILALGIGGGVAGRSAAKMAKIAGEIRQRAHRRCTSSRNRFTSARQVWALKTVCALLTVTVQRCNRAPPVKTQRDGCASIVTRPGLGNSSRRYDSRPNQPPNHAGAAEAPNR